MANDLSFEQQARLLKSRDMYERGLVRKELAFVEAPTVTPHDLTIDLPANMRHNPTGHAYGQIDRFVEYLRQANNIPGEAQIFLDDDPVRGSLQVKFEWWTVEGWTKHNTK